MAEQSKYKSLAEWAKADPKAYDAARNRLMIDDICIKHGWKTPKITKPNGHWTEERCLKEALKYKTKKEFDHGNPSAYVIALKNGWLKNYTHLKSRKLAGYWSKEMCRKEAVKYKTRKEFEQGCTSAYQTSLHNEWLDEIGEHFKTPKRIKVWNKEKCQKEAIKYKTRGEFQKMSKTAYVSARKYGWLNIYVNI